MRLQIDSANGLPIYEQVVRQLKFAVASGKLRRSELVPSVRELSKQLAINPNTVARAYRQLQDEDVLETVRGLGMQVMSGAEKRCRAERKKLIAARLKAVLDEARQSGLLREEVRGLVEKELSSFPEHEESQDA
jgi:GntR family transcriptional regulator